MKVEDRHLEQTNATVTLDFFFYLSIYLFIGWLFFGEGRSGGIKMGECNELKKYIPF